MDESATRLLQRIVRRIPTRTLKTTLEKWDRLSAAQRLSLDFTEPKWTLLQKLVSFCEENEFTMKHITELEMIHVIENPDQGMWYTLQLLDPEDDAQSVELMMFREQFKSHLHELISNVSVKIKRHTDESVWIRIAWGDGFSRINHLKPTYVVHQLQSPYVFVSSVSSKRKPLLLQALTLSTRHQAIKDANLSGRKLTAIRDLVMRQYQQVFPSKYPSCLSENDKALANLHIEKEQAEASANRCQLAGEAFGGEKLPELQSAVYKLETKFRDPTNETMMEREEPFRCVVKFTSTNLLESLKHCASTGIASTPVTPLLSSIPSKGRNYFVITDNAPGAASQTRQTQN
ncbi:centromere protein N [Austrofundulus limnaeus]|uniref:Centromere protein N n=1 Tax=Austrofundulus limnaeus TaxID=52670 RepID=A0A2I4API6_AUSLI|nr:PREDICTED: centromere protein N [Austrofundulus limnaeus]